MTGPKFETVAIPEVTRAPKDNPYLPAAEHVVANRGTAIKLDVPMLPDLSDNDKEISRVIKLLQRPGADLNATIRVRADGNTLTVWAVDRITRPRKSEDTDAL